MAPGANDWSYDNAGNATSYGSVATLSWDALNMQTEHSEGGVDYISVYGPGEYRAWVEDSSTGTRYWTMRGPSGQILSEYEVTDESGSVSWNHKRDLLRGAEGAVAAVYNNGKQRYFHTDHLGTPRVLTDGSGAVVGRHHYYPFGEEIGKGLFSDDFESGDTSAWGTTGRSDELSIVYTGHQRELHRTSDYMLGRHYFMKPGRFASVDPARDGWNLYSYAAGDPVNNSDPTGLYVGATNEELAAAYQSMTPAQREQFSQMQTTALKATAGAAMLLTPGPEELLVATAAKALGRLGRAISRGIQKLLGKSDEAAEVVIDSSRHPESAAHIVDAQASGQPSTLTIDRPGAAARRREA